MTQFAALPEGFILGNRYVVDRMVGYDEVGITYSALDLHLQRRVALRERFPQGSHRSADGTVHDAAASSSQSTRDQFVEAARRPGRAGSPAPTVFSAFDANNTHYLVLDFVEGTSGYITTPLQPASQAAPQPGGFGQHAANTEPTTGPQPGLSATQATRIHQPNDTRFALPGPHPTQSSPSPLRRSLPLVAAIAIAAAATGGLIAALMNRGAGSPTAAPQAQQVQAPSPPVTTIATSGSATTQPGTETPPAPEPQQTAAPQPVEQTPTPAPQPDPVPQPKPALSEIVALIDGTNGVDDITNKSGEGFLSMRRSPSGTSRELRRIYEGNRVLIRCQVVGRAANSSKYGRSSVWAQLTNGNYVAMVYLRADGLSRYTVTVPC